MKKEPSYYYRVAGIFRKNLPEQCSWYLRSLSDQYKNSWKSDEHFERARKKDVTQGIDLLTAEQLINLALNTRLFHTGVGRKRSQKPAAQFEFLRDQIGPTRFEYMYANAIYHVALQSTNLMEMALFFLEEITRMPNTPGINVDVIEAPGTESFDDGTSIRRFSPGFSQIPDTQGEKLKIIRREAHYRNADIFLGYLSDNSEELASAISSIGTIDELLHRFNTRRSHEPLQIGDERDEQNDSSTKDSIPRCNAFLIEKKHSDIWCNNFDSLATLVLEIKSQLLGREEWRPSRRPLWTLAMQNNVIPFPIRRIQ
jgi:hypothetical protein